MKENRAAKAAHSLQNLQERFAYALHTTSRDWHHAVNRRLKRVGVSQVSWLALSAIANSSEANTQNQLAQRLEVEPATVVALMDRLEKAGLIERQKSCSDRRVRLIVLTVKANQLLNSVKHEVELLRNDLLKKVDSDMLLVTTELLEELKITIEKNLSNKHGKDITD